MIPALDHIFDIKTLHEHANSRLSTNDHLGFMLTSFNHLWDITVKFAEGDLPTNVSEEYVALTFEESMRQIYGD